MASIRLVVGGSSLSASADGLDGSASTSKALGSCTACAITAGAVIFTSYDESARR